MRRLFLAAVAGAICFEAAFAQRTQNDDISTPKGREVLATIAKWADAVRDRNTKLLNDIFDDQLIITTADGKTRGKAEELEMLKPNPRIRIVAIKNDDIKLRIFGETSVATALTRMHIRNGENDVQTSFRYTAVFVRRELQWQLVALHISSPVRPATEG